MFREVGVIDFVIKILHELFINGWLLNKCLTHDAVIENDNFSSRVQEINDQQNNFISQEIELLSESISNFLFLVIKNSYENSLYVV